MAASRLSQELVLHSLGLEAGGLTQTLLPGHVTQVAEPMAAWCMHRGLQQGTGSRAQTHQALPISRFFPKCKESLIYGQHLSIGLTSQRAQGLLTPAMAYQVARGEKRKTRNVCKTAWHPQTPPVQQMLHPSAFLQS